MLHYYSQPVGHCLHNLLYKNVGINVNTHL